ncbi:MAG: response regulator transcription factor [Rhodospirillales bacterium]
MSESNPSVLIVEDDPMIRSFIKAVLEAENYDVTEAETGAEMFAALDGANFDVIVLDIMLPDGNGVDFARTLRRTSSLPIVFATAVTDTDTRRRAIGLMQVDYVTKPFDVKELLLRIKNIRTMAPVMEDPNARDLPKPVPSDAVPWYRSPLTWAPAVAFLVIVLGGIFLIPGEEDPATLRAEQTAAQAQRNADTATAQAVTDAAAANAAAQAGGSSVVLKDARPAASPDAGAGAAGGATAAGAGGDGAVEAGSPEQKILEACGELPVSEHWNNNSIKRVLRYVRFVHRGNWGEYLETWVERLKNLQDLEASGKPVELQKKGVLLSGKDLETYAELMEKRVLFLRCASQIAQTIK